MDIVALIIGIIVIFFSWFPFSIGLSGLGLMLAILGKQDAIKMEKPTTTATVAIVLNAVAIGLTICFWATCAGIIASSR